MKFCGIFIGKNDYLWFRGYQVRVKQEVGSWCGNIVRLRQMVFKNQIGNDVWIDIGFLIGVSLQFGCKLDLQYFMWELWKVDVYFFILVYVLEMEQSLDLVLGGFENEFQGIEIEILIFGIIFF